MAHLVKPCSQLNGAIGLVTIVHTEIFLNIKGAFGIVSQQAPVNDAADTVVELRFLG